MIEPVNPRNYKFCPKCGNNLVEKFIKQEQTERLICSNCNFIFYINPVPAVAVILMNNQQIVLVKRKYQPRKGAWSLPAGFMEFDETTEQTAIREAKEETNLDIKVKELFGVFPGFDDPRAHVVLIVYWAEIVNGQLTPGDDAEEVRFFSLNKLPEDIAFTSHRKILERLVSSI
ncbi:MAG: NUDIX hydrolase [bacterium]|nr:MAG: NUDIX hydrolase [bacterium]